MLALQRARRAGGALFGRNFDWEPNPALVLHTDPPDGYASVSIVDISYLGVASDPTGDPGLLDAPLLPFDGMNERGLFVGLAADESGDATPDPAKPTVGGVRIIRLVLDGRRPSTRRWACSAGTTSTSTAARRCTTWSPTRPGPARSSSSSTGG